MSMIKTMSVAVAKTKALHALWTFPTILCASFMIGWGAEAAQYFISRGLALAILAWLQTLPEFAVEASLAWNQDTHNMLANLTGSLRLLVGLGWPMIYFTRAFLGSEKSRRFSPIDLHEENAVEVFSLALPLVYFSWISLKNTLALYDGFVLLGLYLFYLWMMSRMPPEQAEEISDMPLVSRKIIALRPKARLSAILGIFAAGGVLLYICVEYFVESLLGIAVLVGVPTFVMVQLLAPFLSEFPEKLTAFSWARRPGHAPMALMNMISSNINQWTLLVAMMMILFSISKGEVSALVFDEKQIPELHLTLLHSILGLLMLLDLRLRLFDATLLLGLWTLQVFDLHAAYRNTLCWLTAGCIAVYVGLFLLARRKLVIIGAFRKTWTEKMRRRL